MRRLRRPTLRTRDAAWAELPDGTAVGLGSVRLSVLDLSDAGHQPMRVDGHALAYNGEVYNHRALRDLLEDRGERFVSTTDTEVVARLLRAKGRAALKDLNGMFALAWWDEVEGTLLLARDRFGIKPLYYTEHDGDILFASEAKALFAAGLPARLNLAALPSYLSFGWVPGWTSLFEGVEQLAPGSAFRWSGAGIAVEEFHDTRPAVDETIDLSEAADELRSRMVVSF